MALSDGGETPLMTEGQYASVRHLVSAAVRRLAAELGGAWDGVAGPRSLVRGPWFLWC